MVSRPLGPLGGGAGALSYLVRRYLSIPTASSPSGRGYWRYWSTHRRPRPSKLIESGWATSGSLTARLIASPSATLNRLAASCGLSGAGGRSGSAGFGPAPIASAAHRLASARQAGRRAFRLDMGPSLQFSGGDILRRCPPSSHDGTVPVK